MYTFIVTSSVLRSSKIEAVSTMASIARSVELDPTYTGIAHAQRAEPDPTIADAISLAARQTAETLDLPVIVC